MDGTDIGSSDHLLVWMELGRASKISKKRMRVIRRWRLDRFGDDAVKLSYQNALMAEVHEFSESTKSKIERGMKGQELVNEVFQKKSLLLFSRARVLPDVPFQYAYIRLACETSLLQLVCSIAGLSST